MFTQEKFEEIFAKVQKKFDSSPKKDDKVSFSNGTSIEVQKFLETLKDDDIKNKLVSELSDNIEEDFDIK